MHFGEISPNQIYFTTQLELEKHFANSSDMDCFLSEIEWREFSYSEVLDAWKLSMTGYPIIGAGMRQLWQTGFMYNRVRIIVASFLVKILLIHWKEGAKWFWDCLVDADLANNSASWQWVA